MSNRRSRFLGIAMLTLAAVIWGLAFSAQKSAMDFMGPFTCNSVRYLIGAAFLFLITVCRNALVHKPLLPHITRIEWIAGGVVGFFLFMASSLQQIGIEGGDAGSAAFLTALYIVIVPALGVLLGRRPGAAVWCGIVVALLGAYLLTVVGSSTAAEEISSFGSFFSAIGASRFRIARADLLVILCAVVFSFHILSIDRFSGRVDGLHLSMLQFLTVGVLGLPLMGAIEAPHISEIVDGILPLLYLALLSSGVAYTLQVLGQARLEPALASVIMSLESVFGVIGGVLILGERMNPAEIVGCVLVFIAVIVAQLDDVLRAALTKQKRKHHK